jgi:hypothetical protein
VKVAVVGSRTMESYARLALEMDCFHRLWGDFTVISGGAKGADTFAQTWARLRKLPFEEFPADWERYGNAAGARRNKQMVDAADAVVAFWDGQSRGPKIVGAE